MATSTTAKETLTEDLCTYENYIDTTAKALTFSSKMPDGKIVRYVGSIYLTDIEVGIPITSNAIKRERHRCRVLGIKRSCGVCDRRICHIGGIVDTRGGWLYASDEGIDAEHTLKRDLIRSAMKIKELDATKIQVVDKKIPYPKFEGHQEDGTPWVHTYISYDDVTDNSIDTALLQKTTNDYSSKIQSFLIKIWGQEGLRDSIEIFIRIAKMSTYGEKIVPGAEWLRMVLDKIDLYANGKKSFDHLVAIERISLIGDIIFSSRTDSGVITDYHQANGGNVLGLLQTAQSEAAMKKIIEQRMCPTSYQRRVAPPKMGNIEEAEKTLGEFTNTIHTLEELRELPNTVTVCDIDGGEAAKEGVTSDVYASLMTSAQKKDPQKGKFNFAARSKSSVLSPTTLTELMAMIKDGRITKLQLDVSSHSLTYTAKTTLDRDKIIHPYLWWYKRDTQTKVRGKHVVTDITHTKTSSRSHDNYTFRIDGLAMKDMDATSNCCFSEFLDTRVRRTCGPVFEAFNKLVPISVPSGPISLGFGTCVKNSARELIRVITVYVNDCPTAVTISYA